jgi:hypothetical protein
VRGSSAGGVSVQPVTSLLDAVEVVEAYNLSAAARDRTAAPAEFDANEDDILEIEVEGGFTLWTSAQRCADLALSPTRWARTAGRRRQAAALASLNAASGVVPALASCASEG